MKKGPNKLSLLLIPAVLVAGLAPLDGFSADMPKGQAQAVKPGKPAASHSASGHRRGPKKITLTNMAGAKLTLWKPDLSTQPLELRDNSITIPSTGMDNYHAIVAEKEFGKQKKTFIRYEYLRGKPSGHSTRKLTSARKAEFEIVPQPVPREHWHYYSDQTWSFLVRFGDKPVAGVPVTIETSNGSSDKALSDERGIVKIYIPDDFPDMVEGKRDMRSANFMLKTEHAENDITYQAALSAAYRVNQSHWKSFELGLAVIGLGMLAGGYIGRTGKSSGGRS